MLHPPKAQTKPIERHELETSLEGGLSTKVHAVRYSRSEYKPKLIVFNQPTRLIDWCDDSGISEALAGGFFSRQASIPLGDVWTSGFRHNSIPIATPWEKIRGALHADGLGNIAIGPRSQFPDEPSGDLLQAGPVLVQHGVSRIHNLIDAEGLVEASHQFDSDITAERYPRSAIGISGEYLWSVVCDGRSPESAGMNLGELARFMIGLGAKEALNLDGGGSATLITNGAMANTARGDGQIYERGRTLITAIAFVRDN